MDYANAPIREAIFEIEVDSLLNMGSIQNLFHISSHIKEVYPKYRELKNISGNVQFGDNIPLTGKTESHISGYMFHNNEETRFLQIKPNGIVLNVLRPYENWDTHFSDFKNVCDLYHSLFSPLNIIKAALRYINKIEIPLPFQSFQEYIINVPPIPTCLPQVFSNFFMQIQVPCANGDIQAILTETLFLDPTIPPNQEVLPFLLDINVFKHKNMGNTTEEIILSFNELRTLKNQIFEHCITDKTRQLFL